MKRKLIKAISLLIVTLLLISTISVGFVASAVASVPVSEADETPAAIYEHHPIQIYDVNFGGYKSNYTDERFFSWNDYQLVFRNLMIQPFDITQVDYIEFDIFTDVDTDLYISVGSESTTRNPQWNNYFEFYDIRSLKKKITLKAGWNNVCIPVDVNFYNQDPTTKTAGTFNKNAVDGLIFHQANSNYIKIMNFAITSETPTDYVPEEDTSNDSNDTSINAELEIQMLRLELEKIYKALLSLIFFLEQNYSQNSDYNKDGSCDIIDIIIIKKQINEIVVE